MTKHEIKETLMQLVASSMNKGEKVAPFAVFPTGQKSGTPHQNDTYNRIKARDFINGCTDYTIDLLTDFYGI